VCVYVYVYVYVRVCVCVCVYEYAAYLDQEDELSPPLPPQVEILKISSQLNLLYIMTIQSDFQTSDCRVWRLNDNGMTIELDFWEFLQICL